MTTTLQDATSDRDFEAALQAHDTLLVDFYTPACVICRKIEPMLGALESDFPGSLGVVKINAEENPELAARYAVRGVPTVVLLQGSDDVVDRKSGFMTTSMLREWVRPHVGRGSSGDSSGEGDSAS